MAIWGVAAVAFLVGTVLQRVSGTGVGLVCAPILALLLGSAQGVLVTNATTTVSGFLIMLAVRRDIAGLNLSVPPAVMLEMGNMRHPSDAALFDRPTFRRQVARGLTDAVVATLR